MNWKKLFLNWRIILLLTFLLFSLVAIQPQFFGNEGVTIKSVQKDSSASLAGIANPSAKLTPLSKEKIIAVDGVMVSNADEYYNIVNGLSVNRTVRIETNDGTYTLLTKGDETGTVDLGFKVADAPTSNLRKGLDLEGGIRVLLKPVDPATQDELQLTIDNLKERLNVFGLSDVVVRSAKDLSGEDFIVVEIASVTEEEVRDLLSRQGKFEAKIGNETVFYGGKKDITYVCRSAECSGIDPQRGCTAIADGQSCTFFFSITLSPEAAERQAALTRDLEVISENGGSYLSKDLTLYLDDQEVDSLKIGADLKGRATTNIQISGSGSGITQQEAMDDTLTSMKRLQTVIVTGSLPVKLEIVKLDTVSPSLGKQFLNNVLIVGLLALLAVIVVIFLRYRTLKIVVPMLLAMLSEVAIVLGFAALVGWNLDLAAIAGIIVAVGTGVDDLIVITDETINGEAITDWKKRIKNAMFIVMGAYLTTLAGMIPLLWAGAGLLKGFALTTIAGISIGVLIARPAFAVVIEFLLKE